MEIYSTKDLARMLQVTEKTARKCLRTGRLKGSKIARKGMVHEDAIRDFLQVASKQS